MPDAQAPTPPGAAPQLSIFGDTAVRPVARRSAARRPVAVAAAATLLALPRTLEPFRDLLHLGTSSWSFAGWQGLVYADADPPLSEGRLSRDGLGAYSAHPLLGAVGIDRGFYAPIGATEYARYAAQVPPGFRFLVKAPAQVTDALRRDDAGRGRARNPGFLDPALAIAQFVQPAIEGLGDTLGTLLFQFSPLPAEVIADPAGFVSSLRDFVQALPRALPAGARYAVELRDPPLLTPRLVDLLRDTGVEYCIGLHDRMPPIARQLRAHERLHPGHSGPLVVRWTLHAGIGYEAARTRYAPFTRLLDPDPATRGPLAAHAAATLLAGQPVTVIANNKAEGSAPLTLAALADAIAVAIDALRSASPGDGRTAS